MNVLMVVFGAFATYYLALSISQEDGPFNLFAWLRGKLGARRNWVSKGIGCIVCVSCYTGLLMASLVIWQSFEWRSFLVLWFGFAGASVTIERWWKR